MEHENYLVKGYLCYEKGELDEAVESFSHAVAINPNQPNALHGLGMVALRRGNLNQAREIVERAIALEPESAVYLNTMGEIYRQQKNYAAAENVLLRSLQISPGFAAAHNTLGVVHLFQRDFPKALGDFDRALNLASDSAMFYFNKGLALKEMNCLDESITAFRQAIFLDPNHVSAHLNLSIALLLSGELRQGFEEYEWRLRPEFTPLRQFSQPRWDGMIDPKNTLLVYTEQGFGDTIQFIRYLPFIAAEGMRVIVQCPVELQTLLQGVEGISMAYAFDEELPDFDAYIPLLSLPLLFQTDLSKIPANVPYVVAPFGNVQAWREKLTVYGDTVKIGLRWAGNPGNTTDDERSFPLATFEPLAGLSQVTFISLQNAPLTNTEKVSAEKLGLVDVSADLHDFVDTAALIENLNLVISADTAVLHLAGALGRPVWGLQKHAPHWPWLLEREDSPWYPSMRLFRQKNRAEWGPVMSQVDGILRGVMKSI